MDETAEPSNIEASPIATEYAGYRSGDTQRAPKSPRIPLICCLSLIGGSSVVILLTLTGIGLVYLLSPVAGLFMAGFALSCASWSARRDTARRRALMAPVRPLLLRGAFILSASMLLVHGLLVGSACNRFTFYERSALLAPANLRMLARTLDYYCERFGTPPTTLGDIVQESCTGHWMPILVLDESRLTNGAEPHRDSSYAYHPGLYPKRQDPQIVIAFEKSPWTIREIRLFYELGHSVLFADGQVRFVCQANLKGVLEQDRKRREELGWPVCDWSKMYP